MRQMLRVVVGFFLLHGMSFSQTPGVQIEGREVARTDDVVFREIDAHTWVGTGRKMANESLYLVEGDNRAVLIDAGTSIADLDKVVASITKKPVTLVATHAHPDHTGSAINYFPELYIHPGDAGASYLASYKGKVRHLKDGEMIDLGGRTLEVVFTPGHTPGSTTFLDSRSGYGFSGDSFGSGNLLVFGSFSMLIESCKKTSGLMEQRGIRLLFPGHYMGRNAETKQRVDDILELSREILAGKLKGESSARGMMGMNFVVSARGVRINYSEKALQ